MVDAVKPHVAGYFTRSRERAGRRRAPIRAMVKRALLLVAAVIAVAAVLAFTVSPISPQTAWAALTASAIKEGPNTPAPRSGAKALKILHVDVMKLASDYSHKRLPRRLLRPHEEGAQATSAAPRSACSRSPSSTRSCRSRSSRSPPRRSRRATPRHRLPLRQREQQAPRPRRREVGRRRVPPRPPERLAPAPVARGAATSRGRARTRSPRASPRRARARPPRRCAPS